LVEYAFLAVKKGSPLHEPPQTITLI
jgi:hypothetical protein